MSTPTGHDPIDRLRAADPLRANEVPDASLARVSARIQEHVMTDIQHDPAVRRSRGPLAWVGGLALVGALGLAIAIAFAPGFGARAPGQIAANASPTINPTPTTDPTPSETPTSSEEPAPSENPAAGGGMASCIMYDPSILPTFDIVFDGTVTAVDGDQVTFKVNHGWKGVEASVTLTAPQTSVALLGPAPDFTVGGRYLVTAAGSNINSCGYTLDYDAATAAAWAAAFPG